MPGQRICINDNNVCTLEDIGVEITGIDAPPYIESINQYLSCFAKPLRRENGNVLSGHLDCLNCGQNLDGALGHFRWGICHGEGTCSCGWPCRAYHRPKHKDKEIFDRGLQFILQYHPDYVKVDEPT